MASALDAGGQRDDHVDRVLTSSCRRSSAPRATSFCEVASRMRVATQARRRAAPSVKTATSRCGLRSLKTAIAAHVVGGRHRAVDRDGDRHRVAVLDQRRDVELDAADACTGARWRRRGSRSRDSAPKRPRPAGSRATRRGRARRAARRDASRCGSTGRFDGHVAGSQEPVSQERDDVLDLLRRRARLAAPRGADPRMKPSMRGTPA